MMEIPTLREPRRGCGHRKPGGLYLVSDGAMEACGMLPVELTVCPTCGEGIKPARGWTWVDASRLVPGGRHGDRGHWERCPLTRPPGQAGLIWVGAGFYKSPREFMREAVAMGVSRRIGAIPKGLVVGETLVLLAHRDAVVKPCAQCGGTGRTQEHETEVACEGCDGEGTSSTAAVFSAFTPTRIEYVVTGEDSEEELEALVERGIRPVRVEQLDT